MARSVFFCLLRSSNRKPPNYLGGRSFFSRHHHLSTATDGARTGPPPIRVSPTPSAGRGVFATRRIAAGDLVHTAKPLLAHPSPSLLHQVCYYCLRRLKSGDGDNVVSMSALTGEVYRFCSAHCLESSKDFVDVEKLASWLEYDNYCKARKMKYPLLVKRLACMVISGAMPAEGIDILQPAALPSDLVLQMEEEFQLLRSTFSNTQFEDKSVRFLTGDWYVGVLARIRINAFRIELVGGPYEDLLASAVACVGADASVGNAVYMLPSFYNHDCDPNTHIIWIDNADAKMKALRDIEADEELRICYIDASMDRSARQELLFGGFGFHCSCARPVKHIEDGLAFSNWVIGHQGLQCDGERRRSHQLPSTN